MARKKVTDEDVQEALNELDSEKAKGKARDKDEQESQDTDTVSDTPKPNKYGLVIPNRRVSKEAVGPSPHMQALMKAHERKFGKAGVYTGDSQDNFSLVIRAPLILQHLLGVSGIPIQCFIFVSGPPKSYKTSLMVELLGMAMRLEPVPSEGLVLNTEGKWSSRKARALISDVYDHFSMIPVETLNDWQKRATLAIDQWIALEKKQTKSNPLPLLAIGVDSLCGAQTQMIKDKVTKEGVATNTFQDRAKIIWQWIQSKANDLLKIPSMVVITNHERIKPESTGRFVEKVSPGGDSQGYVSSCDIGIYRGKALKTSKGEVIGYELHMYMKNNSLGPAHHRITVPYFETFDEDDNQVDWFDWDAALTMKIYSELEETKGVLADRLREVVGNIVEYHVRGFGKVYTCDALGVTKSFAEENLITASVLGSMLSQDPDMYKALQKAFRVDIKQEWEPGTRMNNRI